MKFVYSAAGVVLLALLYFVVTPREGLALALTLAFLVGVISFLFWWFIDSQEGEPSNPWFSLVPALTAVFLGETFRWTAAGFPAAGLWGFTGLFMAALAPVVLSLLQGRSRLDPCFLCRTPTEPSARVGCPRCRQAVCMRPSCWDARHVRCTFCFEREVVIFPIRSDWWNTRLGPRVSQGQCDSCYREAHETELHECGRCHWPLCRRCWDHLNGKCPRCGWTIPDVPEGLALFLQAVSPRPG